LFFHVCGGELDILFLEAAQAVRNRGVAEADSLFSARFMDWHHF
jgi:hypothetical protein